MAGPCKSIMPPDIACLVWKVLWAGLTALSSYVGAEDGIYEFHVDVCGRKLFPHVMLR